MTKHQLQDAFDHHVWATLRVIDACSSLSDEQLHTFASGTYGSILDTLRHIVGGDAGYLFVLTDGRTPMIEDAEEAELDLAQLRSLTVEHGRAWSALLAENPDPERVVVRHRDDGTDSHAPTGIRLAQALHHGTDHRSKICTALTTLGIEPPEIDLWEFGRSKGRVFVTPVQT
jgi:uncharacterized damage-inducible protein DinB